MRQRSTTLIMILIAVILLNVILVGTYWWLWGVVHTRAGEVSRLSLELANKGVRESAEQQLIDFVEQTEDARRNLDALFVTDETFIDFLEELESLGLQAGVSVDSTLSDQPTHIEMSLRTKGSFSDTMRYMRLLETMHYGVTITRISTSVTRAMTVQGDPVWDSVIVIRALSRKE